MLVRSNPQVHRDTNEKNEVWRRLPDIQTGDLPYLNEARRVFGAHPAKA